MTDICTACGRPDSHTRRWPVKVSCYGRHYEAHNDTELADVQRLLVEHRLVEANRYRIGASWPRGRRGDAR
jgi:hypothetical protein